ncbi:mannan-binding lectin serine protease 1-like isoform X2 [Biomphalaria glabrata]|uniref:Mannan-binding lectin serine protease 1-like isoform X2 n=1 Tax=Biomphalaria glabrata TaxID=6526 RepID=A0A9W2ZZE3_BIOGL|nr:mannan-binding lectin serine protease 1-like isoform X2 [Biomphalaria glabrata]
MRLVLSFGLVWAIAYVKHSARGLHTTNKIISREDKIDFFCCGQRPLATDNGASEVAQTTDDIQGAIPHSHPSICSIRPVNNTYHMFSGVLVKNLAGKYYIITNWFSGTHPFRAETNLAILIPATALPTNRYITAACLPNEDWYEGEKAISAGWYNKSPTYNIQAYSKLHQFQAYITSRATCEQKYRDIYSLKLMCTSLPETEFFTCNPDFGSPLYTYRENRWTLTGIAKFIGDCYKPDRLGMYTDIFQAKDWINSIIN